MESALDEVSRHCGPLLRDYQACVTQNPTSWSVTCLNQRRGLTECAENKYVMPCHYIHHLITQCVEYQKGQGGLQRTGEAV